MPQHLGIDVEKNISTEVTETQKRLCLKVIAMFFLENVNIIGGAPQICCSPTCPRDPAKVSGVP
jgi:hypothetical protein